MAVENTVMTSCCESAPPSIPLARPCDVGRRGHSMRNPRVARQATASGWQPCANNIRGLCLLPSRTAKRAKVDAVVAVLARGFTQGTRVGRSVLDAACVCADDRLPCVWPRVVRVCLIVSHWHLQQPRGQQDYDDYRRDIQGADGCEGWT